MNFAVNYLIGGIEPYGYKLTNFLFHLLTAAAIFLLMSLISRVITIIHPAVYRPLTVAQGHWIALFAAIIWLIHPLHISTILYVVQRMAQLATLFTILGLCAYVKYRIDRLEGKHSQGNKDAIDRAIYLLAFGYIKQGKRHRIATIMSGD